jgi:hypothetical protein
MAERTVVNRVDNAVEYSDGTILIKDVRASYPHVLVAKKGKDPKTGAPTDPKFSITALLPKKTHMAAKNLIKGRIDAILKEHKVEALPAERYFLRNGNLAGKPDYMNHFTVSAGEREDRPPSVRDKNKVKLTRADAAKVFGGCWVNVLIRPWWQANAFGKRVNAGLVAVQFVRADDAFGEGRISEDEIDETFEDESGSSGWEDEGSALELEAADL